MKGKKDGQRDTQLCQSLNKTGVATLTEEAGGGGASISLTAKPDKDSTHTKSRPMIFYEYVLRSPQHTQRVIHHDQLQLITGMQVGSTSENQLK